MSELAVEVVRQESSLPQPGSEAVVLVAHGTANLDGQRVITDIVAQFAARNPSDVFLAYVDVQDPKVEAVVSECAAQYERVIVVPLLLAAGYHVRVDIARAVKPFVNAVAADPLGPSERIAQLLAQRLRQAGATEDDAIVLAAAGSSRPEAAADTRTQAQMLGELWGTSIDVGFGSASTPSIADAVAADRDWPGRRVVVASLLLAPGHFHDRLLRAGADIVSAPLGVDDLLVEQIEQRVTDVRASLR